MQIYTTYKVKIKHYNHIFKDTVAVYRHAVDYLIGVCDENWGAISEMEGLLTDSGSWKHLFIKQKITKIQSMTSIYCFIRCLGNTRL